VLPLALLNGFWDAFFIVVVIIDFFMLYRILVGDVISNQFLAAIIVAVITILLVLPYPAFAYLLFGFTFLYSIFWTFKPYRW